MNRNYFYGGLELKASKTKFHLREVMKVNYNRFIISLSVESVFCNVFLLFQKIRYMYYEVYLKIV